MLTAQWHRVQATTRHKQGPPTSRLRWELNQVLTTIHDATLFLEKITGSSDPENKFTEIQKSPRASFRTGSLGQGCSLGRSTISKIQRWTTKRINIKNSCIIFIHLGEQSLCTLNSTKRGGCTIVQNTK